MERDDAVTMKGNPLTLIGPELKKGDPAPDFRCMEAFGSEVDLGSFGDDVKVFNVVVSVDTPVCDVQIRRFNEEAAGLSGLGTDNNGEHGSSVCAEPLLRGRRSGEGEDGVRLPVRFFRRGLRGAYKGKPSSCPLDFCCGPRQHARSC